VSVPILSFVFFIRVAANLEYSRDFSEHGKLRQFCATQEKIATNKVVLVHL